MLVQTATFRVHRSKVETYSNRFIFHELSDGMMSQLAKSWRGAEREIVPV